MQALNTFYKLSRITFCSLGSFMKFLFNFLIILKYAVACQGFNTTYTCCDTCLGNDLEGSNGSCIICVCTAAKLFGEVTHGYNTDIVAVFFTKECHSTCLLGIFNAHDLCQDRNSL